MSNRTTKEWMQGKPFIVTASDIDLFRCKGRKRFYCKLCNNDFSPQETARWIYANGTFNQRTGNFFVCSQCDGLDDDVLSRARLSLAQAERLATQWGLMEETKQ